MKLLLKLLKPFWDLFMALRAMAELSIKIALSHQPCKAKKVGKSGNFLKFGCEAKKVGKSGKKFGIVTKITSPSHLWTVLRYCNLSMKLSIPTQVNV